MFAGVTESLPLAKSARNIIPILGAVLRPCEGLKSKFPHHFRYEVHRFFDVPGFSTGSLRGSHVILHCGVPFYAWCDLAQDSTQQACNAKTVPMGPLSNALQFIVFWEISGMC